MKGYACRKYGTVYPTIDSLSTVLEWCIHCETNPEFPEERRLIQANHYRIDLRD